MWITETPTGRYKCTERYTDPLTGRSKTVSVTIDRNTPQARNKAAQTLSDRISETLQDQSTDITLRKLCDLYLVAQEKTVKPSTYTRNKHAMTSLCRIIGKDVIVSRLTAGYVKARFLGTGEEPGRLNERLKRIRALLRWAYQNDMMDTDITGKLGNFHDIPHVDKIMNKYMSSAEYLKVISGMERKDYKLLTQFLVLSGLRYGEFAALEKKDVDLENRYIIVDKTYDSETKTITTTKTETSVRRVYVQDDLLPVCRQINVLMGERKLLYGCRSDGFFFDQRGRVMSYFVYAKYLRENTIKLIGREITPHTLRHTHASLMFEKGVPLDVISRRLGHKTSQITRNIYIHITEEMQKRDNDIIRNVHI